MYCSVTLTFAYLKTRERSFDDVDVDPQPATAASVPGRLHSSSAGDMAGRIVWCFDGRDKYKRARSAPGEKEAKHLK